MLTSMVALRGKFLLLQVSNHEYQLPSPRTLRVVCLQEEGFDGFLRKDPEKISASLRKANSTGFSLIVTRSTMQTSPGVQALLSSLSRGVDYLLPGAMKGSYYTSHHSTYVSIERVSFRLITRSTSRFSAQGRTLASCICTVGSRSF